MTTLSLTEAKARLSQIADEVQRTHQRVTITRNGRSHVVLVAVEDIESLEATLELLADTHAGQRVEQGRRDIEAGLGTSAEEMAQLMAERRDRGGA